MTATQHLHTYQTHLHWAGSTKAGYRRDMAASSCQPLSFLAAAAARRDVDILDYDDDAYGEMPDSQQPMRITRILLRPVILVAAGTEHALVEQLVQEGHRGCCIANTVNADVIVEATVVTA